MKRSFLLPVPLQKSPTNEGETGETESVLDDYTRRRFLKRTGGATVAAMVAWSAANVQAAHLWGSCSHKVVASPSYGTLTTTMTYMGVSMRVLYETDPVSGSDFPDASVVCYAEVWYGSWSIVMYGPQLKGYLSSPNCDLVPTFPADPLHPATNEVYLSSLTGDDGTTQWRHYVVLSVTTAVNTGSPYIVRYTGSLNILVKEYTKDSSGNYTIFHSSYIPPGSDSRAIALQVKREG